jgi:hypothetical protein
LVLDSSTHHHWLWLVGAAVLITGAIHALMTGKVAMLYSLIQRSDDALLYWVGVSIYTVLGVSLAVLVLW